MSKNEEEKDVQAAIKKLDLSKYSGLTKEKKALLKDHMGSATSKIDMNKVKEWWKYENRCL
ncbi:hypothetical protein [Paenibacillus crassostreae]|uniref:Uncharacterized protein n=1 Tax=Paenibacillus crassostreae TaxID=1763538 RepID=A0A167APZ1_9BACL|nr:hypothetical protein [Paenibacillus crassostreae]AOZ93763.1 hypothetical protein LPB68_17235 [Paenibacillus crassostreae]OAB71297.1 hypothetical protein PNBC_20105 [Paenibacillus crassostreae]